MVDERDGYGAIPVSPGSGGKRGAVGRGIPRAVQIAVF